MPSKIFWHTQDMSNIPKIIKIKALAFIQDLIYPNGSVS